MNLYLLKNNETVYYGTYDSIIIAALSTEDAIHLSKVYTGMYQKVGYRNNPINAIWRDYYEDSFNNGSWCKMPTVHKISDNTTEPEGVVCAGFYA